MQWFVQEGVRAIKKNLIINLAWLLLSDFKRLKGVSAIDCAAWQSIFSLAAATNGDETNQKKMEIV